MTIKGNFLQYDERSLVQSMNELICSESDASIQIDELRSFSDENIINCFYNFQENINSSGPSCALVKNWISVDMEHEPIYLNVLFNAYVFGGSIIERDGWYHNTGQLLLTENKNIIKASFGVMDGHRSLPKNLIIGDYKDENVNKCKLRYKGCIKYQKGVYYFLGSIHRHFGHFLLEGLSRLWALDYLPKNIINDLKFIVYEEEIRPFAFEILKLYGIEKERVVSPGTCSQYEKIYVPDTSYRTHRSASYSFLNHITIIKSRLSPKSDNRKVFLSRRYVNDRKLINRDEVENLFRKKGFEIIHPEKMSLAEQITTIMESRHIAGEVGTQLYLSMFASKGITVTVLAPKNFYLKDDYLISRLLHLNLNVIFGTEIDFSLESRIRPYSVNIEDIKGYFEREICD